ncbi:hypothetical protein [Ruminococcus albus]|uniref:LPXTG-motif cell wall anchor domain-containing protein n=1 Tax=Ruminococcus albus TaxID=1264 RepID=A0A1I1Q4Q2_RUMAL|nr:hypothetical protein [Ruminococcus albus]SFD17136.1 hypothetical protein SAMN02910406_03297 [Ruminococcus albus]
MMNKKLFAMLASAALMASFAPSVFAEANDTATESAADTAVASDVTASLEIKAPATAEAGKEASFDVYLTSSIQLSGIQFNFTSDKGEITGFTFDDATMADLGFDDYDFTLTATEDFKALGNDDYQIMAVDTDFKDATVPSGTKIGTLTVKAGEEGDVITIDTKGNLANYDYGDGQAAWTTTPASVTVAAATESAPESAVAPESSSTADSVSSTSSSESTSTSESSKATTNTSSKATNGTTSNTNTGAASTAAVALAASAAALVVISKKRK